MCEGTRWLLVHILRAREFPEHEIDGLSPAPLDFLNISEQLIIFFHTSERKYMTKYNREKNHHAVLSSLIFPIIPLKDRSTPLVHATVRTE